MNARWLWITLVIVLTALLGSFLTLLFLSLAQHPADQPPSATSSPSTSGVSPEPSPTGADAPTTMDSFIYSFNTPGVLNEAGSASASVSPYWFLDSGGEFIVGDGIGSTIQGSLPTTDHWRVTYAETNPLDTDDGYHPQNIFRLVTKKQWGDATVEAYFDITNDNLSKSPNRNASNGLLLMTRYQDHDTLYYSGIRVDGTAVIKKKYQGTYYTMAQVPIFPGTYGDTDPNLLPHGEWLGLRSTSVTNADGSVSIHLYLERACGQWQEVASAEDTGQYAGTPPITAAGEVGIRTDFMDVDFKEFKITPL